MLALNLFSNSFEILFRVNPILFLSKSKWSGSEGDGPPSCRRFWYFEVFENVAKMSRFRSQLLVI